MTHRLLIVDDNAGFLAAARGFLEREGATVVGEASTCAEAIRLAEVLRPDVALVDIDLGPESGFDVARRMRDVDARTPVVLISAYAEAEFTDLVAESPAVGFIAKSEISAAKIDEVLGRDGNG
jgi:DNA-binding NarL/FixJ family response regulator